MARVKVVFLNVFDHPSNFSPSTLKILAERDAKRIAAHIHMLFFVPFFELQGYLIHILSLCYNSMQLINVFKTISAENLDLTHMEHNDKFGKYIYGSDRSDLSNLSENTINSSEMRKITSNYEHIFVNRDLVNNLTFASRGEYGDIFHGMMIRDKNSPENSKKVLVKTVSNFRNDKILSAVQHELNMFYKLSHDHLVRVIGMCFDKNILFLVLNYDEFVSACLPSCDFEC